MGAFDCFNIFACGRSSNEEKSDRIDEAIYMDRKMTADNKVLLLGPGESGKSTIVKQMRIIHKQGFTPSELAAYRPNIRINLVDSMKQTLTALQKLKVKFLSEKTIKYAELVMSFEFDHRNECRIPPEVSEAIYFLWNEAGIKNGFDKLSRFSYVLDSAPYFFTHVNRISDPAYLPNTEDILKARIKTTGITSDAFFIKGQKITIIDVGGQRSERRKWYSNFENISVVIFCASLCDYDQVLTEDNSKSRILESLELFDHVVNLGYFEISAVVLFLNKTDLFLEKIKVSPLENYFEEYKGGSDPEKAKQFILNKYLSLNEKKRVIYHYFTCATDTKAMEVVLEVVQENFLRKFLDNP